MQGCILAADENLARLQKCTCKHLKTQVVKSKAWYQCTTVVRKKAYLKQEEPWRWRRDAGGPGRA